MRASLSIIVVALPFLTGCNLFRLTAFNGINEPLTVLDNIKIRKRAVEMAREAWLEHLTHIPENCPPQAYETGFIHGYADYLLMGGNGAPPAIPPNAYRRTRDLNPEGHLEIRAYYTGFAVGADAAKASGRRVWFQIPISGPLPAEDTSNFPDAGRETEATFPPETLPTPQKSEPTDPKKDAPEGNSGMPTPFRPTSRTRKPQVPAAEPIELIPLPLGQPMSAGEPKPEAPTTSVAPVPSTSLPREFTLPIQGGPGAR